MASVTIKESAKNISVITSEALNVMGYGEDLIRHNAQLVMAISKATLEAADSNGLGDIVLAGSRGEGVAYESGLDVLCFVKGIICVEEGSYEEDIIVLKAEMSNSPPGYTKLSLVDSLYEKDFSFNNLFDREYISSLDVSNRISNIHGKHLSSVCQNLGMSEVHRTGPAISYTNVIGNEVDMVYALPFYAFSLIDRWANRRRLFDMPSSNVVESVTETSTALVPSTLKESSTANLEWRICFPHGDQKLIYSMNDTQKKLYVLLKIIKKEIISKEVSGLTSYMLKNVVCWVCEGMPSKLFTADHLLGRFRNAIQFLMGCLINNFLPCYFVPERNLIIEKLSYPGKQKLQTLLADIKLKNLAGLHKCKNLFENMRMSIHQPTAADRL